MSKALKESVPKITKALSNASVYSANLSCWQAKEKPLKDKKFSNLLNDLRYLAWYVSSLFDKGKCEIPYVEEEEEEDDEVVDEGLDFAPRAIFSGNGRKEIVVYENRCTVKPLY